MNTAATRFNGTLKKWNAERGFGFVMADHGDQEFFVHVSAFPRDGRPPTIGESLSFEMELDKDGRKRAVRVRRPGAPEPKAKQARHPARSRPHQRTESSSLGTLFVAALLVAGLGWYGYTRYTERAEAARAAPQSAMSSPAQTIAPARTPTFQCDGRRYCSQMTSCSEAKLYLKNCPGMEMDGDNDGIPCEQQLCTGLFGG